MTAGRSVLLISHFFVLLSGVVYSESSLAFHTYLTKKLITPQTLTNSHNNNYIKSRNMTTLSITKNTLTISYEWKGFCTVIIEFRWFDLAMWHKTH